MQKSTHKAEVIPLILENHPNASKLSIVRNSGYTIVVNTEDWAGHSTAVHVLPDSILDTTRPEFKWLDKGKGERYHIVKPVKLRGVHSFGLLTPTPSNAKVGDDVAIQLGITHYESEDSYIGGDNVKSPIYFTKYDVDTAMKYSYLFQEGETVYATEKVHGANCRVVYKDGELFVGSRNHWKADMPGSLFWQAFRNNPLLEKVVRDNPNFIVFGEAYGDVKGYKYDCVPGEKKFATFDIFSLDECRWLDYNEGRELGKDLWWCPLVEKFEWSFQHALTLATGPSLFPNATNKREGVVISTEKERICTDIGRVKLKIVSPEF